MRRTVAVGVGVGLVGGLSVAVLWTARPEPRKAESRPTPGDEPSVAAKGGAADAKLRGRAPPSPGTGPEVEHPEAFWPAEPAPPPSNVATIVENARALQFEDIRPTRVEADCPEIGGECRLFLEIDSNISISYLLYNLEAECGVSDDPQCTVNLTSIETLSDGSKRAVVVLDEPTQKVADTGRD